MKKIFLPVVVLVTVILCSSCKSWNIIPQATNSAGMVGFGELNLSRSEYVIFNTISEKASVSLKESGEWEIKEVNNEFSYQFYFDKKSGQIVFDDIEGVVKLGYLYNSGSEMFDMTNAGEVARRLAIFRLTNSAKEAGADYLIEPIVSVDINQTGRREITYTATASAKLVKIKKTDD